MALVRIVHQNMATAKMKKVALLYAPQNANFAEKIVAALTASGFDAVILEGGAGARMVAPTTPLVVIWSPASIVSEDILQAARQSLKARRIIPISLGKTPPPAGFEHVWPMDLVGWNHDANDPRWQFVVDELEIAYRQDEVELDEAPVAKPVSAPEPAPAPITPPDNDTRSSIDDVSHRSEAAALRPLDLLRYTDEAENEIAPLDQIAADTPPIADAPPRRAPVADAALRAPRKPIRRRKGKTASRPVTLTKMAARFMTPGALAGGVSAGLLGVIGLAVLSSLPGRSPAAGPGSGETPIVAFVEPRQYPQTDPAALPNGANQGPREILPHADGLAEEAKLPSAPDDEAGIMPSAGPVGERKNIDGQSARPPDPTQALANRSEVVPGSIAGVVPDDRIGEMALGSIEGTTIELAAPVLPPRLKKTISTERSGMEVPGTAARSLTTEKEERLAGLIAETADDDDTEMLMPEAVSPVAALVEKVAGGKKPADDAIAELTWNATKPGGAPRAAVSYFKECVDCPDMASLPTGSFMMGSPYGEASRRDVEGPRRAIKISRAFSISTQEITFDEWDACVRAGGCRGYGPFDAGWGRGRRPVVNVSFDDARAYCAWLSDRTGANYRLPSEAEWEYAARAGTATAFSFGARLTPRLANYHGEFPYAGEEGLYRRQTIRVASFAANPFGLYDMHGNVREWTADCWADGHLNAPENGAPREGDCTRRAVKGGAWNSGGWRLRSAHRYALEIEERTIDTGFRVVREAD